MSLVNLSMTVTHEFAAKTFEISCRALIFEKLGRG